MYIFNEIMNLSDNDIEDYVKSRIAEKENSIDKVERIDREISTKKVQFYRSYISSQTAFPISFGFFVKNDYSFVMDSCKLYEEFIRFLQTQKFDGINTEKRFVCALLLAIYKFINSYFGCVGTRSERLKVYESSKLMNNSIKPISIDEFHGKDATLCAERAVIAQNLLSFLNMNSELFISSVAVEDVEFNTAVDETANVLLNLINGKRAVDNRMNDPYGLHIYNVVKSNGHRILFDTTLPTAFKNIEDNQEYIIPTMGFMTDEEYESLKTGETYILNNDILKELINPQFEIIDKIRVYGVDALNKLHEVMEARERK